MKIRQKNDSELTLIWSSIEERKKK